MNELIVLSKDIMNTVTAYRDDHYMDLILEIEDNLPQFCDWEKDKTFSSPIFDYIESIYAKNLSYEHFSYRFSFIIDDIMEDISNSFVEIASIMYYNEYIHKHEIEADEEDVESSIDEAICELASEYSGGWYLENYNYVESAVIAFCNHTHNLLEFSYYDEIMHYYKGPKNDVTIVVGDCQNTINEEWIIEGNSFLSANYYDVGVDCFRVISKQRGETNEQLSIGSGKS